jgi:hypothetical protein
MRELLHYSSPKDCFTCPLPNLRVGSSPVGRVNMYARWQVLCRVQTALQQQTSNAAYSIVQRVSWYTTRLCRGYAQFTTLLLFDAGEAQKGESRLHRKTLSLRRHRSP